MQRLKYLLAILSTYGFWIVMMAFQKPVFMIFNPHKGVTLEDFGDVIWHGLRLDACMGAYLVLIPLLVITVSYFIRFDVKKVLAVYTYIIGAVVSIIFAVDCILFSYWGFRIDATLIFYLKDFSDAASSVTWPDVIRFIFVLIPYYLILICLYKNVVEKYCIENNVSNMKIADTMLSVLYIGLLFVCSRGGVSTATANIGMVYYSSEEYCNLAAVNPVFSLMSSWSKKEDFSSQYQYFADGEAEKIFQKTLYTPKDSTVSVLNSERPNVLVIIMESFTANAVSATGVSTGTCEGKEITPNLNRIAKEGINFTNAYSNAMRTDRGVVSVLTGFLAQPNMSIIKYPEKTRSLPSLAKVLGDEGYSTYMLYGGDVNFANMRSYFYGTKYQKVEDETSFPAKDRQSKWGVNDTKTFDWLYSYMTKQKSGKPFFDTYLTLSSHEPFDVSMHRFSDKYLNSVAYTDSCLGSFINKIKKTDLWKNLLVVIVADHGYPYPKDVQDYEKRKYHIPLVMTGGAVKKPFVCQRYVNQTDIPKTILSQMHLKTDAFIYSRDVFNPYSPEYAFYVFNNGFCFMDSKGGVIYDCNADRCIGTKSPEHERKGKALLQKLYKDIASR